MHISGGARIDLTRKMARYSLNLLNTEERTGILREARVEFVILFGFRPKLVKIVKQNRTEFFSQIKKITNS
jgi:hypothetical protein